MRVIEVNMERHRSEEEAETGDPRENPSTNGIVRHDSHLRKSGKRANRSATVAPQPNGNVSVTLIGVYTLNGNKYAIRRAFKRVQYTILCGNTTSPLTDYLLLGAVIFSGKISRHDTVQSIVGSFSFFDWLKLVLVRVDYLHANNEGTVSVLRTPGSSVELTSVAVSFKGNAAACIGNTEAGHAPLAAARSRERLWLRVVLVKWLAGLPLSEETAVDSGHRSLRLCQLSTLAIDFKRVYSEVAFAIGSEFIRHVLDDSAPITNLQGNKTRLPFCQMWCNTGATANEQTSKTDFSSSSHVANIKLPIAKAAAKGHAEFALLFGIRLNFTLLYALEPASFLHWLLHRCEDTPSLTELLVIGAHNLGRHRTQENTEANWVCIDNSIQLRTLATLPRWRDRWLNVDHRLKTSMAHDSQQIANMESSTAPVASHSQGPLPEPCVVDLGVVPKHYSESRVNVFGVARDNRTIVSGNTDIRATDIAVGNKICRYFNLVFSAGKSMPSSSKG
ncbi:hypothetical protein PR048_022502 [Dryococelus australis]|uniref:Uncharacterized protein n=1 Tax=Dryococelus australis TaxID=614101 RepID=A0ABQ9H160_9NEOP|nr:hypothetical protein PR048_022502 [Dryococelus australis]